MNKYLLVYYGGKMETDPQKVSDSMKVWNKWFADMGKSVIDMGGPAQEGKIVDRSGMKDIRTTPVTGYSVIQANDMDAVLMMVKNSPQISDGGQIAIYPLMSMMTSEAQPEMMKSRTSRDW